MRWEQNPNIDIFLLYDIFGIVNVHPSILRTCLSVSQYSWIERKGFVHGRRHGMKTRNVVLEKNGNNKQIEITRIESILGVEQWIVYRRVI